MRWLLPLSALALAGCTPTERLRPEAHPLIPAVLPDLEGRWDIVRYDDVEARNAWISFGKEGLSGEMVVDGRSLIRFGGEAFLGCNRFDHAGWVREGGKIRVGKDPSLRTERGCGDLERQEQALFSILTTASSVVETSPGYLHWENGLGSLEMVRNEGAATS